MKKIVLIAFLMSIATSLSGCATILGGIIGHQSGEAVAGAAIGAAIDFGDDIARAVGIMLEGDKITVYQEPGLISVKKSAINPHKLENKLSEKFAETNWQWTTAKQSTEAKTLKRSAFDCSTAEGKKFTLEFEEEKGKDLRIYIRTQDESPETRSFITSQLGLWVKEIIGNK